MFLNIGFAAFIFLLPFSPKIPVSLYAYPLLLRVDDIVVPILFLIWLIELLRKKRRIACCPLYLPVGVYFLAGIVATLVGYYFKGTIPDPLYAACVIIRNAQYYIIFFLTVNIITAKRQVVHWLNVWLSAAILISLYGIADYVLGVSGPTGLYDKGWFHHQSNHMGGYLMISLILAVGLTGTAKARLTKNLSIIAVALTSFVIVFNLSRTTYISALTALCVFFAMKNKKLLVIPAVCAIILFLLIPRLFPDGVLGKRVSAVLSDIFSTRTRPVDQFDSMALHRAKLIYAFRDFPVHFVFGKGLGYPLHVYDSQIVLVPVSTGIVGSIIFIWLLIAIFRAGLKAHKAAGDTQIKSLTAVFIAAYFGVLAHSITTTAFMIALIAYPFWILAGIACAAPALPSKEITL